MLDKSIARLEPQRHFAELDACIIAMKRKLTALSLLPSITMPEDSVTSELRYHSIISLAERFVAKLDDYEQHPDDYADGSLNSPTATRWQATVTSTVRRPMYSWPRRMLRRAIGRKPRNIPECSGSQISGRHSTGAVPSLRPSGCWAITTRCLPPTTR